MLLKFQLEGYKPDICSFPITSKNVKVNKEIQSSSMNIQDINCNKGQRQTWRVDFKHYVPDASKKRKKKDRKMAIIKKPEVINPILSLFNQFKRKTALEFWLTLILFPNAKQMLYGLQLFRELTQRFHFNPVITNASIQVRTPISSLLPLGLLNEAIKSFFKVSYGNLCLFIETGFNINEYPVSLQYTIIACGLMGMKSNETIVKALKYLDSILFHYFSNPMKVKPSLSNLQAQLLISCYLTSFDWVTKMRVRMVIHLNTAVPLIGLNQECYRLSNKQRIERRLAYASLVFYTSTVILACGTMMPVPFKIKSISNAMKWNLGNSLLDIKIKGNLIIGEYQLEMGSIMHLIRLLKEDYLNITKDELNISSRALKLHSQLDSTSKVYLNRLNILMKMSTCNDLFKHFQQLKYIILYQQHFYHFFLYSFNFYHSNINASDLKLISAIIHHCIQVIHNVSNLSSPYLPTYLIPNLSFCISFLLRYSQNDAVGDLQKHIDLGLLKISQLEEITKGVWLFNFTPHVLRGIALLDSEN